VQSIQKVRDGDNKKTDWGHTSEDVDVEGNKNVRVRQWTSVSGRTYATAALAIACCLLSGDGLNMIVFTRARRGELDEVACIKQSLASNLLCASRCSRSKRVEACMACPRIDRECDARLTR
jgi:hypothetical protein